MTTKSAHSHHHRLTMIEIQRLAKNNADVTLTVQLDELTQLTPLLAVEKSAEPVAVSVTFSMDEGGSICLHLIAQPSLALICQRCLQPYLQTLALDVIFSPIKQQQEARLLPESYEPALLENDSLSLVRLFEEELILSIPLVPKHTDYAQCSAKGLTEEKVAKEAGKKASSNPFAVLKKLKKTE